MARRRDVVGSHLRRHVVLSIHRLGGLSLFDRLYSSVAMFTPLRQTEGLPALTKLATKAIAMGQALLGVALTALLISVLYRRITR